MTKNLPVKGMMGDCLKFAVAPLLSPRPHHHLGLDVPIIRAVTRCMTYVVWGQVVDIVGDRSDGSQ